MNRSNFRSRRTFIKGVGAATVVGLSGCQGDGDTNTEGDRSTDAAEATTTGSSGSDGSDEPWQLGISVLGLQDVWLEVFARSAEWYAADRDDIEVNVVNAELQASKQTSDIKSLINSGVDGILTSAVESEANASPVDEALDEGIPVFAVGTATFNDRIPLSVGSGWQKQGQLCGERLVEGLEDQNGEPSGKVAIVNTPLSMSESIQRREGFMNVVDEYNDIEVVNEIETDATVEDASTKATDFLRANSDIDGVYATQLTTGMGVQSALERLDMQHPAGHEDHVVHVLIDSNEQVNEYIVNEYVEGAILDAPEFYHPIAMKYMVDYLEADQDEDVLPSIGDTVTEDDLTIGPSEHAGVEVWSEPVWAPAEVIEFENDDGPLYPHLFDAGTVVGPENVDDPALWTNWSQDLN